MSQALPLAGIRVIDYSHFLAGPYVGRCLAALGAEVIKVERPGSGDAGRQHAFTLDEQQSGYFLQLNMGKQGVSVNMKDPRGKAFMQRLTDSADGMARTLTVKGRTLTVPRSTNGVAWVGFSQWCEQPLGAEDYLALARRFPTVILEGVPVMGPERRDAARRFVALIDSLVGGVGVQDVVIQPLVSLVLPVLHRGFIAPSQVRRVVDTRHAYGRARVCILGDSPCALFAPPRC